MLVPNHLSTFWVICAAVCVSTLIGQDNDIPLLQPVHAATPAQNAIASLANGNYQFCTQPQPNDWRDGAGVCLNFSKLNNRIDGYYGYPHSDSFVCVRGNVNGNIIAGEALTLSWPGDELPNVLNSEFKWDTEGHLRLNKGKIIRTSNSDDGPIRWILFRTASLNTKGFYRYTSPRMTAVSQLCDWN